MPGPEFAGTAPPNFRHMARVIEQVSLQVANGFNDQNAKLEELAFEIEALKELLSVAQGKSQSKIKTGAT